MSSPVARFPHGFDLSRSMTMVLALGLGARLVPFALAASHPDRFFTLDAVQYVALARDLYRGYFEPGSELFDLGLVRTPGYPTFAGMVLRVSGDSVAGVILAQITLSLSTILVTYLLALKLLKSERAAIAAALILALDPATALYANFLQPEALFTLLAVLAALTWFAALKTSACQPAALAGTLIGLAVLTRPIALFLPAVLVLTATLVGTRSFAARLRLVAVAMAPFLAIVLGWVAHNAALAGAPVLSTIQGVNLLYYRAAGARSVEDGRSLEDTRRDLSEEVTRRLQGGAGVAARSQMESRVAFEVLGQHPMGAMRSAAEGMVRLLAGTGVTALSNLRGDEQPEMIEDVWEGSLSLAFGLVLGLTYVSVVVGGFRLYRGADRGVLFFVLPFVGYFLLISAGPEANTRFRVPLMPFLALIAAGAASPGRPPQE